MALFVLVIGAIVETRLASPAQAETTYTPYLGITERYDSNIYFAPKEFVPAGDQQWDLVTTMGTGLRILNQSRLGDTELKVGGTGNYYTYTPKLSYWGVNAALASDVSPWVHELIPGMKLKISDTFQYTPEPPAFLTGGKPAQSDIFARGIQAYRANTYSNIASTDAGYSLSRTWGLRASYSYNIFRIGQLAVSPTTLTGSFSFFDTTVHSASTGPTYTFDGGDSLYFRYSYMSSKSEFTEVERPPISFTAHTFQPEFVTTLTRGWTATISGGATVVEQAGNKTFFSGKLGLINDFDRRTRVSVAVSRQAAPSYFGVGGAVISNVVQLYLSHNLSRVTTLTISGNYAHNETTPVSTFTFETIGGSAVLAYNVTRSTVLSLSQTYDKYTYTGTPTFDRYSTILGLTTEWK